MSVSVRGMLSLLAVVLCLLLLSACVKYFPREEQTTASESGSQGNEVTTVWETNATTAVGDIPNLPSDDATKRY